MNSKKNLTNNNELSENNKNQKEEKPKSRYEFKYHNKNFNNSFNSKYKKSQNDNSLTKEESNRIIHKDKEDFYKNEIFVNSISKYNFGFFELEYMYKYNTINVTDSFLYKFREIFTFDKNRSYNKYRVNITPIELSSELNLSFEKKNNKSLILGNPFNKENQHLNNIVQIFDKFHKQTPKINKKQFQKKYNNYYIYKNRINNYNYLKFKNISKFSKKEKEKTLTKNHTITQESHTKLSSGPIRGINNIKYNLNKNKENSISAFEEEKENLDTIKKDNEFATINEIYWTNNTIFNNIISEQNNKKDDRNLIRKENNNNSFIKNSNVSTALSKKINMDKSNENSISVENNNNNRNSVNFSGRFFYKYRAVNNINRKAKSFLEEAEKDNNNDQTMNDTKQIIDNIKKGKIIKIDNIEKNRIINKKVPRNEIIKNSKKIYTIPKLIKKEINQNENKEKINNKRMIPTNPTNNQIPINNDKNEQISLIINRRKKNVMLSKNNNEYSQNYYEKNKNEENSTQINPIRSLIQSNQSTSQSLFSEKQKNRYDSNKPNNSLNNLEDAKDEGKKNTIKLKDKNLVNSRSFIFNSEKINHNKITPQNCEYKGINSPNNDLKQKKPSTKEIPKIEYLNTERFKRRYRFSKKNEGDNNNINHITQDPEKLNLTNNNKIDENPFRDSYNYYYHKKSNNRFENHKFHEIKSTSREKNIKKDTHQKENKIINYKADNRVQNPLFINSSMRYLNLRTRFNNLDKDKNSDDRNEKNNSRVLYK